MLSEKIINLRKSRGWSQEELAERLNVSRQSVSKWESGISNPDLDKIVAMSTLFGVTTDYLLKDAIQEELEPIRDFVIEGEEVEEAGEGEYGETPKDDETFKKAIRIQDFVEECYWTIVLVLYLLISFLTRRWDITWIIWIVGGIFSSPVEMFFKRKKKTKIVKISVNQKQK
jgi:transcriptional regulator with XRE-family HTH domain